MLNAENYGCQAAILYSDPMDVAYEGTDEDHVYPNTFWLPGTGMQRGSIYLEDGDPETPGWPSLPGVFRIPREELAVPNIPAQPIGYDDALEILSRLEYRPIPEHWDEGALNLPNGYTLGGAFDQDVCPGCQVKK